MFSAGQLQNRLSIDFSLPGQPGDKAEHDMIEGYGTSSFETFVAVVTVPPGETVQQNADEVAKVFDATAAASDPSRLVDLDNTGDQRFVSDDGRTTFALIQGPQPTSVDGFGLQQNLEQALGQSAKHAGFDSGLTSYGMLSAGGDSGGPGVLDRSYGGSIEPPSLPAVGTVAYPRLADPA